MADFVFNLSENTINDRLQLVKAQAQQKQLTPILQTLIDSANIRNDQRYALLDQLTLLQSDKATDNNSLIRKLYEKLDRAQFPIYTINSWTAYYSNYINHNISVYDNYANRANVLMNQALRNNLNVGAPIGNRPAPPIRYPYERDENRIIKPLCPASGRFLTDSPLENDLPITPALMEKILITDSSTRVILLYHSLDKIISNITKYGFSRMAYKDMLLYIARIYYPHLLAELEKTSNIYGMLQVFQSSLFGFTEHRKVMDSIQKTQRQPGNVLTDFILTLKRKLKFLYLIKHKNMLEREADDKAEKFIITQNLLLKFLDTRMQENAYKIMEAYARL